MAVNYVNLKCLDPFISHFKNCVGCSCQYYKLQLFAHSGDLFITAISVWNGFGILSLNKIWECLALCPGFSWDRVNYPFSSWWSVKEIKTVSGNCLGRDIETARRTPFPARSQAAEAGCLLPLVDGKQEWDWAQLVAEWGYPAAAWEADFASLRKHPRAHTQPAPSDASVGKDWLRDLFVENKVFKPAPGSSLL